MQDQKDILISNIKFELILLLSLGILLDAYLFYIHWALGGGFIIILFAYIIVRETSGNKKRFMESYAQVVEFNTLPSSWPYIFRYYFKNTRKASPMKSIRYPQDRITIRRYSLTKYLLDSPCLETRKLIVLRSKLNSPFVLSYTGYVIFEKLIMVWVGMLFPYKVQNVQLKNMKVSLKDEINEMDFFDFQFQILENSQGSIINATGELIKLKVDEEKRVVEPIRDENQKIRPIAIFEFQLQVGEEKKSKEELIEEMKTNINSDSKSVEESKLKPLFSKQIIFNENLTKLKPNAIGCSMTPVLYALNKKLGSYVTLKKPKIALFPTSWLMNLDYDKIFSAQENKLFNRFFSKIEQKKHWKVEVELEQDFIKENNPLKLEIRFPQSEAIFKFQDYLTLKIH